MLGKSFMSDLVEQGRKALGRPEAVATFVAGGPRGFGPAGHKSFPSIVERYLTFE